MRRSLSGFGAAAALLLSLHACSSSSIDPSVTPGEGGTGDETTSSADGDGASALDGAHAGDALAGDAAVEAGADGGTDGGIAADAGPPVVRFIGRFDTSPAAGPKVGFPGASIFARFAGTEVKATFADELVYTDYGKTRWNVIIDGGTPTVLEISRATATYTLATGLPMGTHTVELVKITEAQIGTSQFMGFDFSGGTLLAPPPAKTRHIEFLGDSASNGYGVEGACPTGFTSATENASKSYPALAAKDLSADHHNLSASGKGLYQNNYRPDLEVYSIIYPRILPFTNGSMWSFATYTPDVVWMTLGGNDYDDPDGDPLNPPDAPPFMAFQAKYDEMVALIRNKRPSAHIFCAVAPSLSDAYPPGYDAYTSVKTAANNVVTKYNGLGDSKIYFFEFTRSQNGDLTGCDGHPNAAKHRSMADEVVAQIKAKTMWP